MSLIVVLDACVLFPASLRDTLLRAAAAELYRIQITDEILEEVSRNLIKKRMPEDKAQRLVAMIQEHFGEAFVTHHRPLIASMPNDLKDRHVLAAAVACRAQVIVTQNLKDFPQDQLAPFEVEAQSPDKFLEHLYHLDHELVAEILLQQAENLHSPSMTVLEVLDTLKLHVPVFANLIRKEFEFQKVDSLPNPVVIESDIL